MTRIGIGWDAIFTQRMRRMVKHHNLIFCLLECRALEFLFEPVILIAAWVNPFKQMLSPPKAIGVIEISLSLSVFSFGVGGKAGRPPNVGDMEYDQTQITEAHRIVSFAACRTGGQRKNFFVGIGIEGMVFNPCRADGWITRGV